jgi:hypothetical protein
MTQESGALNKARWGCHLYLDTSMAQQLAKRPHSQSQKTAALAYMQVIMHQCNLLHNPKCAVNWDAWMEEHPVTGNPAQAGVAGYVTESEQDASERLQEESDSEGYQTAYPVSSSPAKKH